MLTCALREANNLKLWQGESEVKNTELPIMHINRHTILENSRVNPMKKQPDKPTALLAHCFTGLVCQSQAISLKPEWKRGSYRFKHFPLGFISSVTRRRLPGLIGLPGNLLLHRWLGRMTARHGTKCVHGICQITVC